MRTVSRVESTAKAVTVTRPELAEPHLACEECGKSLWCHHDFAAGEDVYFCPTCDRYEPAA